MELYQPLSTKMSQLQNSIVDAMRACLQELHNANIQEVLGYSAQQSGHQCAPQVEEFKDITLEIVLSEPFDRLVRSRLEKQWHKAGRLPIACNTCLIVVVQVSGKTKQLGSDLSTLRRLLTHLLQADDPAAAALLP